MRWPDDVRDELSNIVGQTVCRTEIGEFNSLSVGFGERIESNRRRRYGRWEAGTYLKNWRILEGTEVKFCCLGDLFKFYGEDSLNQIFSFGSLLSVDLRPNSDVSFRLDNNLSIEFLRLSMSDEYVHIFCPDHRCIEVTAAHGARIIKSNKPTGLKLV